MEITLQKENEVLTLALAGRLDTSTVRELETCLKENLSDVTELVFDFTALEYLSSAGLRVLLASHKHLAGHMTIKNANETVLDVFRITGMSTIFRIE